MPVVGSAGSRCRRQRFAAAPAPSWAAASVAAPAARRSVLRHPSHSLVVRSQPIPQLPEQRVIPQRHPAGEGRGRRSSRRCPTWCRSAVPPSGRAWPARAPPFHHGSAGPRRAATAHRAGPGPWRWSRATPGSRRRREPAARGPQQAEEGVPQRRLGQAPRQPLPLAAVSGRNRATNRGSLARTGTPAPGTAPTGTRWPAPARPGTAGSPAASWSPARRPG